MSAWRPFNDPLTPLWNIAPARQPLQLPALAGRQSRDQLLEYAVERKSDGQIIGRLSLRDIQGHSSARLGIRLGAEYVDEGYGTEALCLFLPHCFRTLGLQRLRLDVAAINRRAIHVYERLGFRHEGRHYRNVPGHVDLGFLHREGYKGLRVYFRRHLGRKQLLFLDMLLEARDWQTQQLEAPSHITP